jgi:hypothetical protein
MALTLTRKNCSASRPQSKIFQLREIVAWFMNASLEKRGRGDFASLPVDNRAMTIAMQRQVQTPT